MRNTCQFILLGLLVVLLAAAATPSFLEAQIRQRTARAYANLATIAGALEAYRVDYMHYPGDGGAYCWDGYEGPDTYPYNAYWYPPYTLTTPAAYLTGGEMIDPFAEDKVKTDPLHKRIRYVYVDMTWGTVGTKPSPSVYYNFLKSWYGSWNLTVTGPDTLFGPYYPTSTYPGTEHPMLQIPYDPTNGLNSSGDILRSQD